MHRALHAGIGINIAQTAFRSDAPNPISVAILTGVHPDPDALLGEVGSRIVAYVDQYLAAPQPEALKQTYMQMLYPGIGRTATYREPGGEPFRASISDVGLDGRLYLSNGRDYAFKEVALVL